MYIYITITYIPLGTILRKQFVDDVVGSWATVFYCKLAALKLNSRSNITRYDVSGTKAKTINIRLILLHKRNLIYELRDSDCRIMEHRSSNGRPSYFYTCRRIINLNCVLGGHDR